MMLRVQESNDALAANRLIAELACELGTHRDCDVDRAGAESRRHTCVPHLLCQERHAGPRHAKRSAEGGQGLEACAPAEGEPQAAKLACGGLAGPVDRPPGPGECSARALEQRDTGFSEPDFVAPAQKQLRAQPLLDLA